METYLALGCSRSEVMTRGVAHVAHILYLSPKGNLFILCKQEITEQDRIQDMKGTNPYTLIEGVTSET